MELECIMMRDVSVGDIVLSHVWGDGKAIGKVKEVIHVNQEDGRGMTVLIGDLGHLGDYSKSKVHAYRAVK